MVDSDGYDIIVYSSCFYGITVFRKNAEYKYQSAKLFIVRNCNGEQ